MSERVEAPGTAPPEIQSEALRVLELRHRLFQLQQALALSGVSGHELAEAEGARLEHGDGLLRALLRRLPELTAERERALEDVHHDSREDLWWYADAVESDLGGGWDQSSKHAARNRSSPAAGLAVAAEALPFGADAAGSSPFDDFAQQPHERQLVALRLRRQVSRWRLLALASGVFGFAVLGGSTLAFLDSKEKAEHEKAALQQQLQAAQSAANRQVRELEARLKDSETMSQARRQALQEELEAARERARAESAKAEGAAGPGPASAAGSLPVRAKPASKDDPAKCKPGDPMCGGL